MKFAIVALLPEPTDDPTRADFISKEFETGDEVGQAINELEEHYPKWRIISICHIEDLPLLMEGPK